MAKATFTANNLKDKLKTFQLNKQYTENEDYTIKYNSFIKNFL